MSALDVWGLRSIMCLRDVSFAPTQRVQHKPARARKPARTSTQHGYCITAAINNVATDNVALARAKRTTRQREARQRKARADRTAGVGKGLHGGGKGTGAGGGGMVERAHDEEGATQAWWGTQNIGRGLNNGKARRLDEEKEARRRGGTHRGWEVEIQGSWPSDRAARVCAPFALRIHARARDCACKRASARARRAQASVVRDARRTHIAPRLRAARARMPRGGARGGGREGERQAIGTSWADRFLPLQLIDSRGAHGL